MKRSGGSVGRTGYYSNSWGGNQRVSTVNLTKLSSKLAKGSGYFNALQSIADIGSNGYSEGGAGPRTGRAVGRAIGSVAGSAGGAFVGAGVGTIVAGPPGSVIGGVIGSSFGGTLVSDIGNEVV